jgi:alpha-amylase
MPSVCLYFQVHQPIRVRKYRVFDVGQNSDYFSDNSGTSLDNKFIIEKVSKKSYLPANEVLLQNIKRNPNFKVSFSISGLALEQFERYAPEVISSFKTLLDTGNVELLSETYHHSLASIYSEEEFREQIKIHRKKLRDLFGISPTVFRNTELIYNNNIAKVIESMGYKAILAEGADHILGWRSPTFLYKPLGTEKIKLLLKHYKLSDDIAFRFGDRNWIEWPLTADKFANWISAHNGNGQLLNLFMDYETFGEHQWEDTGIFEFLRYLPEAILDSSKDNNFLTVSEAAERYEPEAELNVEHSISWADMERDLSAWISNELQREAIESLYSLEKEIYNSGDLELLRDWRYLQASDHFYYMCTKYWNDGDVHKYFSPYESPHEAYIAFMNVLHDVRLRLEEAKKRGSYGVSIRKLKPLRFADVLE